MIQYHPLGCFVGDSIKNRASRHVEQRNIIPIEPLLQKLANLEDELSQCWSLITLVGQGNIWYVGVVTFLLCWQKTRWDW